MPVGQYERESSSTELSSSQLTLVCVKLTKTNRKEDLGELPRTLAILSAASLRRELRNDKSHQKKETWRQRLAQRGLSNGPLTLTCNGLSFPGRS